jgi:hypothetical protein
VEKLHHYTGELENASHKHKKAPIFLEILVFHTCKKKKGSRGFSRHSPGNPRDLVSLAIVVPVVRQLHCYYDDQDGHDGVEDVEHVHFVHCLAHGFDGEVGNLTKKQMSSFKPCTTADIAKRRKKRPSGTDTHLFAPVLSICSTAASYVFQIFDQLLVVCQKYLKR